MSEAPAGEGIEAASPSEAQPPGSRILRGTPAGLVRRLAAIVYDALLLFAVLYFATAPLLLFTGGTAIPGANPVYRLYLLAVAFLYFGWCWTHGGQTLGMKAWRLHVTTAGGRPLGWKLAAARFALAIVSWLCLGAGFLWALVHRQRLTWHDLATHTRIVHIPK